MMILNKNNIFRKNVSVYDLILIASMFTNVACLVHFQEQNKRIKELVEKNNLLTDSINKLNQDITKMGQEITIAQSKSLPVVINTSEIASFNKPLMVLGVLVVSLGTTYFLSSAIITKVSSMTVPKLISFASVLAKLPILEQTKELTVSMEEMSMNLFIRILNDQILDVKFRHIDDEFYKIESHFSEILNFNFKRVPPPNTVEGQALGILGFVAKRKANL